MRILSSWPSRRFGTGAGDALRLAKDSGHVFAGADAAGRRGLWQGKVSGGQEVMSAARARAFGPSLIPEHYTRFETSGLEVDVQPGMDSLDIALTR